MNSDHVLSLLAMQTLELSVVIALVWIAAATVLRRRPHLAYALWMVVLVKAVMPPVWSCPTGVFSWVLREPSQVSVVQHSAIAADFSAPPMSHEAAPPVAATVPATHSRVTPSASPAAAASPPLQGMRSATVILLGWLTGSALVFTTILIMTGRLRRRVLLSAVTAEHPAVRWLESDFNTRQAGSEVLRRPGSDGEKSGSSEYLRTGLGDAGVVLKSSLRGMPLYRTPHIVVTTESVGPALIGVFRPLIVIPLRLVETLSDRELRAIITHETTHLRRGDHWVAAFQRLVISIWWFNPLVWFAHYQINRTRELCCDGQTVANLDCDPADYAQMLVDVLRVRRGILLPQIFFPGVHAMQITTRRMSALMNNRAGFRRRTSVWAWLLFVAASLAVLPVDGWIVLADGPVTTAVTGSPLVLHGQLTDSTTGLPVANASISVEFRMYQGDSGTANGFRTDVRKVEVRSNRDGKYGYPVPPQVADSDRYWSTTFTIRDPDHSTQIVIPRIGGVIRKTAVSSDGQSRLSIRLATCRTVTGRVLGPDHKPLSKVQIYATSWVTGNAMDSDTAVTDQAGRFSVRVVPDGTAMIYGSPATAAEFEIQAHGADVGDIQTQPGRRVTGRVLDADQHPVAGSHVFAWAKHSFDALPTYGRPIRSAVTGADGRYELAPLAAGSYRLSVAGPSSNTSVFQAFPGNMSVPETALLPGANDDRFVATALLVPADGPDPVVDFHSIPRVRVVIRSIDPQGKPAGAMPTVISGRINGVDTAWIAFVTARGGDTVVAAIPVGLTNAEVGVNEKTVDNGQTIARYRKPDGSLVEAAPERPGNHREGDRVNHRSIPASGPKGCGAESHWRTGSIRTNQGQVRCRRWRSATGYGP